jgi:alpha-L-fucosidase 2
LEEIKYTLGQARRTEISDYQESNSERWANLWKRSFVDYGDDYLSNLWYLTLYYSMASQGGSYPGRFNNGLWAWSRDVQNWNFYFHWNQQQLFWPLNAAGLPELVKPYLDFRFRSLPNAKKHAKELLKAEGAFISDVTERRGFNSVGDFHNHTPVAEIALDFWRQYQFTQDEGFLKDYVVPFMVEASRFFVTLFEKGDDGLYHAKEGTGYEGWIKLKDGLTELVYVRALLSSTIEALKVAQRKLADTAKWKEILANLAPLPVVTTELITSDDGALTVKRGQFRGHYVNSDKIVAAGWGIKEKKWLTTYSASDDGKFSGFNLLDGIFPTVPSSPVFPSNLVGLGDYYTNRELFEVMKSTTLLYPPGVTGWDTVPIVMARLGLRRELAQVLARFPERWQIYCNGWGHWGMEFEINKDAEWYFRTNQVKDGLSTTRKEKFPLPMWPFRHMSMESMAVLATAMNESLLQSHDGVLRIAPAFASDRACRFTLHAVGGFEVSAEKITGKVQWVSIKSEAGKDCRIELPWEKAAIYSNKKVVKFTSSGQIATFKTTKGERYLLLPESVKLVSVFGGYENPVRNENAKFHSSGKVQLGLPRMF